MTLDMGVDLNKYEILGYEEIPVDRISPHPNNPRPSFHLGDDDPTLVELGKSIATSGQHRPALVYECVDGWRGENQHGHYRLLQGERRWRSCRIAGVETLRCLIVKTPANEVAEEEWLGIEEAYKQDWQPFFVMRFAWSLAKKMNVAVTDPKITARTGLSLVELRKADKIMRLHPAIQAMVAEYEELAYKDRTGGKGRGRRLAGGAGVRAKEFTPAKAALVWDAFNLFRERHNHLCNELEDVELQRRIAAKVSRGALRDAEALVSALREPNVGQGLNTHLAEFLINPDVRLRNTVRATGNGAIVRHRKTLGSLLRYETAIRNLTPQVDQFGGDVAALIQDQRDLLRLMRTLDDYERALSRRVDQLEGRR